MEIYYQYIDAWYEPTLMVCSRCGAVVLNTHMGHHSHWHGEAEQEDQVMHKVGEEGT